MSNPENLTRREQQVMEAMYELEEATGKEIQARLPNAPSYSAVRAVLSRLVDQGLLKYRESGPRYIYTAAAGKKQLRQQALKKVVNTFFDGSPLRTMNALLGISANRLSKEELDRLAKVIAEAAEKSK